jgi:HlyD family secretion protein
VDLYLRPLEQSEAGCLNPIWQILSGVPKSWLHKLIVQLLELRASQDGVVKDLATHTTGTVVQPGTIMLTLVPQNETLRAEV